MADPIVVFDLDGTLVDTAPDLVASLNYTIASADLAPVGYEDLTHLVGHGARAMIERAFRMRGHEISQEALAPLLDRFIEHYLAHMPGESRPYPGLEAALDRLGGAGFRLAICTNKLERLARPLVEKLGLTPYFAAITGGDTFAFRKPDGRHLTETIALAGGDPRQALMVGDSATDALAARDAGVACLMVPFGYSDIPIEELGAEAVIRHFDELTPASATALIEMKTARTA